MSRTLSFFCGRLSLAWRPFRSRPFTRMWPPLSRSSPKHFGVNSAMTPFVLEFRSNSVGGPVVNGFLSRGSWFALAAVRRVAFLIHGYNVNRHEGETKLDNLAGLLPGASSEI